MCKIVDFSIPQDAGVEQSQDEKFKRYEDAAREIRRIWLVKGKVIPFVVGTLRNTPRALKANLEWTLGLMYCRSPFFLEWQQS